MPLGDFKKILLTKEEEDNLVLKAQQVCVCKGDHTIECGACDARAQLIEFNLRWLFKMCIEHVKYAQITDFNAEEFMADAIDGFSKAIKEHRPNGPERLISYSKKPVISALLASDLTEGVIFIPLWVRQLRKRIKKAVSNAKKEGKELDLSEIAKEVKQSEETVRNAFKIVECDLGLNFDSERNKYDDVISLNHSSNYHEKAKHEDSEDWIIKSDVNTLMSYLTNEEKLIVSAKLGIDHEKLTNSQIRDRLGYTRRKVTRIYNLALSKMKEKAGVE